MKITKLLILILCVISSVAFSKETSDETLYLDKTVFNLQSTLPPPFATDSFESKIELEIIKNISPQLTSFQKDLATKDALNQNVDFFSDVISDFDINKLPKTKTLFDKVKYNAGYQSNIFKNYFMKKRPYQEDNSIQVCVPPQPSSLNRSYPSGHTTMGFAMAVILANLIPEKSNEIMARAKLYGANRVYCGAHFPSDVSAGEVLGTLVGIELLKNSEFSSLLKLSKDELIIHHLTK